MGGVRFGECTFDGQARVLTRAGKRVEIAPKALDLLQELLQRRPRIVSRNELRDLLWPKTFVAYTSLARVVTELRQAIGDTSREPRFIRTAYGRGYAFSGNAVEDSAGCGLLWANQAIPLLEGENMIGRGDECNVRIKLAKVSRLHARISVAGDEAILEDLGSKNGTWIGEKPVKTPTRLREGDRIVVGDAVLTFRGPAGRGRTETA